VRRIAFSKLLMILVSVPLAAAIVCAGTLIYQSWSHYGDLTRASSLLRLAAAAGRFGGIAIPGEGAATRELLTGTGSQATVAALRRKTDELYGALREAAAGNLVKEPKIEEHLRAIDERMRDILAIRDKIDAKTVTSVDATTGTLSPAAQRAADLVGTAAAVASDPVLSRRIFALYATLQFNESTLIQRGTGIVALQGAACERAVPDDGQEHLHERDFHEAVL